MRYIVASTYEQAKLAARQLGLTAPATPTWRHISEESQLDGLSGKGIVLVYPNLHPYGHPSRMLFTSLRLQASWLCQRTGNDYETVRT